MTDPAVRGPVHLDVNVSTRGMPLDERRTRVNEAVERLKSAGATQTRVVDREREYWIEMMDPDGNAFCVQ